jgi:hypothetical protein
MPVLRTTCLSATVTDEDSRDLQPSRVNSASAPQVG